MNLEQFNREAEKLSNDLKKCDCPTYEIQYDENSNGRWLVCKEHNYRFYQSELDALKLNPGGSYWPPVRSTKLGSGLGIIEYNPQYDFLVRQHIAEHQRYMNEIGETGV